MSELARLLSMPLLEISKRKPGYTPCYISVDIETTGRTPGHYSMYELGAYVIGSDQIFKRKIALLPGAKHSPEALRAVGTSLRLLRGRTGVSTAKRAIIDFGAWVHQVSYGDTPIFVANNAPFDWMFVAWYFEECRVKNPFGHAALDMKAFFMGRCGATWEQASFKQMAARTHAGVDKLPHDALLDAVIQGQIFSRLVTLE